MHLLCSKVLFSLYIQIGSPAAILRVEERPFVSGSVSWTCGGGVYFVNTIDRSMVADFHERLQNGEVSRSRSTRSRRA